MQGRQQIHMHSIGFRKMRNLVEHILNREYDTANQIFESEIETVTRIKLNEAKKMVAARMAEQVPAFMGAAGGNAAKLRRGVLEEDDLDEMQIGKSSTTTSMVKDMRLSQEPKWHETNKNLRGMKNPEPRLPNADPNKFRSNTPNVPQKNLRGFQGLQDPKKKPTLKDGNLKYYPSQGMNLEESEEQLDEARIKILKARVRGGKVQRRRKVSNVEGHKIVDGKLKRMSPAERRRRKLGQKRGKLKRRSKMRQALMKRRRSLKRRAAIGL